jgi:hypothetical protein
MTTPTSSSEDERWSYLIALDDELLKGRHVISEYAIELPRNADIYFASQEQSSGARPSAAFAELISTSELPADIIDEMHALQKPRNS